MTVAEFFEIFMEELAVSPSLHGYYKFLNDTKSFEFRKAYFVQRLQYVFDHVQDKNANIWDCGCGYGTTALFLAMNGFKVYGTTLEFYFDEINKRKEFWKKYGDVELFKVDYEDVFDNQLADNSFDYIIVQDTLHHLEPIKKAIKLFNDKLKREGKLIIIEENGSNILKRLLYFKQRGFKRIITLRDEKLQKDILIGNENVRGWKKWNKLFKKAGFNKFEDLKYMRMFLPFSYKNRPMDVMIAKENNLAKRLFLRKYFFYGLCFTTSKN